MAGRLPDETLVLLTGASLNDVWQGLKGSLAAGGNLADFEESMALLAREFGYDPDRELLPLLDDEWALAVLPADEGLVLELADQPLGLLLLAGSGDAAGLETAVADLSTSLAEQRLPLETVDAGGYTATTIDLASLIGAPLPYYGLAGDDFFLGTDAGLVAQTFSGAETLASVGDYQAAVDLLPDGYWLVAYADVPRLLAQLATGNDDAPARLAEPLRQVVAASGPAADGLRQAVVLIIVE
jgi:hypothetical protein